MLLSTSTRRDATERRGHCERDSGREFEKTPVRNARLLE